jgi:formate/nitrite transporter FocA (FNT family)
MAVTFLSSAGFFAWTFWIQVSVELSVDTCADCDKILSQNYLGLSPLETVIHLIPMFVVGVLCNILVALIVSRVRIAFIMGRSFLR